jgi:hypothetical protein
MSEENQFIPGLRAFPKHHNAPDFILADISIERKVLHDWLETNYKGEQYIKAQLKMSRDGKPYIQTNDFKPQSQQVPSFEQPAQVQPQPSLTPEPDQDIPF